MNRIDSLPSIGNYLHDEIDDISIDSLRWVDDFLHEATQETVVDSNDPLTVAISFALAYDQDHFDCAPAISSEKTEGHADDLSSVSEERTVCGAHLQKDQRISEDVHGAISVVVATQHNPSQPITAPSLCDVVEGRGRGLLKLPGNAMYRELVSMNRRIYARCHKYDKSKVSKGIVAAIRDSGGRFLEYNKQTKTYHDIGDFKAWRKASQSLREGLKEIRKQIYSDMAAGCDISGLDTDFLGSLHIPLPAERYVEFSVQMLQVLRPK